ncbi:hypothetical protein E1161_04230 [Saccharopolyspora aridisoli]|uniref:Uncharacterized protein n=1 Tax=Saccharopolyspora aridisoli TaxID=2530385 RepID=A0A4R4UZV5_9PSEU|nr:hypothetical protein [Saccharopolyspora aridisoli]TDC95402.1 hypothetical protein E1161_04230 [Saccharopolyspora aridisoli]
MSINNRNPDYRPLRDRKGRGWLWLEANARPRKKTTRSSSKPKPSVQAAVETVRPSTAREWLKHTRNRNWRPDRIVRNAHDMRAGQWSMTGEPIKFAHTGRLLDG